VDSQIRKLELSADEKRDLVEFLKNLTDQQFVSPRTCDGDL
jgi:hypothetical protein